MSKVSVLSGPERRRRWTTVEKLRIVEESQAPSASVIDVARRHDVHPNLLTVWRRQARTGAIGPSAALRQEDEAQFAAVRLRRSSRHGRLVQELAGRSRSPLQAECTFGSRARSIPRR